MGNTNFRSYHDTLKRKGCRSLTCDRTRSTEESETMLCHYSWHKLLSTYHTCPVEFVVILLEFCYSFFVTSEIYAPWSAPTSRFCLKNIVYNLPGKITRKFATAFPAFVCTFVFFTWTGRFTCTFNTSSQTSSSPMSIDEFLICSAC